MLKALSNSFDFCSRAANAASKITVVSSLTASIASGFFSSNAYLKTADKTFAELGRIFTFHKLGKTIYRSANKYASNQLSCLDLTSNFYCGVESILASHGLGLVSLGARTIFNLNLINRTLASIGSFSSVLKLSNEIKTLESQNKKKICVSKLSSSLIVGAFKTAQVASMFSLISIPAPVLGVFGIGLLVSDASKRYFKSKEKPL